jgi:hypothetical protein
VLAIVTLRASGIMIPPMHMDAHDHGINTTVMAIIDGVAMATMCATTFFVSNWHARALGTLRKSALIEDRATLLAQVPPRHMMTRHTHTHTHTYTRTHTKEVTTSTPQISHDMRQPIHALKMLNDGLEDSLLAIETVGVSKELAVATSDSRCMRDVLAHLTSLADDFL